MVKANDYRILKREFWQSQLNKRTRYRGYY